MTVPSAIFGGTMDLWRIEAVSCVSAMTVPGPTTSPSFTVICVCHFFSVSRESITDTIGKYIFRKFLQSLPEDAGYHQKYCG